MEIIIASSLMGAVVGLICVAIFALTLRRISENDPREAIKGLRWLIITVLGGGLADYGIFHFLLESKGIVWYMIGLGVIFLTLGIAVFIDWIRR